MDLLLKVARVLLLLHMACWSSGFAPESRQAWDREAVGESPMYIRHARELVCTRGVGALASISADPAGFPFASTEDYGDLDSSGVPVVLLADIAVNTQNLYKDGRASLSVRALECADQRYVDDPLACARITLVGTMIRLSGDDAEHATAAFVEMHPAAKSWTGIGSHQFHAWKMQVEAIHWVGGFGSSHFIGWIPVSDYLNLKSV